MRKIWLCSVGLVALGMAAPALAADLPAYTKAPVMIPALYDWSGGLVWIDVPATSDAGAADVRRVIASHGGHATLIRAEPEVRASVEVFQPPSFGVERLSRGLKAAFDPQSLLNPGRMYAAF